MKVPHNLNYFAGFLSALDISGSLLMNNTRSSANGLQKDSQKLMNDLASLKEDYEKAYRKTSTSLDKEKSG